MTRYGTLRRLAVLGLAKKLQNPVASLISVPLQSNWDFGIGWPDAMRYTFNVQPVIPFSLGTDWNLITRTMTWRQRLEESLAHGPLSGLQLLSEQLHSQDLPMRAVAELLEGMKAAGVIRDYAVFGAIAQMRYTEPMATLDVDILVMPIEGSGLDALSPIYRYCETRGYLPQGEAIRVGNWPVQFIPVFSPLTEEAVRQAETGEIEGVPLRVVAAAHLATIALSVGRPKDHLRILSMLEAGSLRVETIEALAAHHGLSDRWSAFKRRYLDE